MLEIRSMAIGYFKRYERTILLVAKFLVGIFIFSSINGIGLYHPAFEKLFSPPMALPFLLFMGALFALAPPTLAHFFIMLQIVMQISQSMEVAIFVFLLLSLVIIFYARLSPQKSYLILAVVIGFHFNIPYAVVIFAGLYIGVTAIIPVSIGTCIASCAPFFIEMVRGLKTPEKIDIMELPQTFLDIFRSIFDMFTHDFNWILIAFLFTLIILSVYFVGLLTIDYAKEISIAFGGLVCVICFMMASLLFENFPISLLSCFVGTIFSLIIVIVIKFLDCVLDYKRTERVQFEDEENYYYVKVVPKIAEVQKPVPQKRTQTQRRKR